MGKSLKKERENKLRSFNRSFLCNCRLLAQWLKQPLKDLDAIVERHAAVEILVNNTEARMNLHDYALRRVPDMQSVALRIRKRRAGLKDCYR